MKSEFMLAFNEICESRGLPKEVVIEALKTALVSAYRRNTNVSNTQQVTAEIDPRTGEPTIFAEKEVVDSIIDDRTEVLIDRAKSEGHTEAVLGDTVMVNSTPHDFGRIAAQTAKQVILQRVREAEREQLFEDFSAREGELVNGTVQSVSGTNITIGLGRTEAVLPKSQQVNGERYRAHDKIRVYVLEVRRTNRGPQIFVSRNHRNLLRRLLELEVPEIYNGQVEIKSIAREAGARSKVAVMALQPGIDPVGACVGMRGVRIQSIVRELNDEKIDVIEWDPDQKTFIAKALSPARVAQVFLEENPYEGKTAVVIVPDDQLSLAIGREGQNARLAAKLTGWRIDIKSLTEAAAWSLDNIRHAAADSHLTKNAEFIEQVKLILAKKEANRPITSEDYSILNRLVAGVEGRIIGERAAGYDKINKERNAARKRVAKESWDVAVEKLPLSARVRDLLVEHDMKTAGDILFQLELGDENLLKLDGLGEKALEEIKEAVAKYLPKAPEPVVVEETTPIEEIVAELVAEAVAADGQQPEAVAEVEVEVEAEPVVEAVAMTPAEELEAALADVAPIEDLEKPLISLVKTPEKVAEKPKAKPGVVIARPVREEEPADDAKSKQKGKELVFDESQGKVVVKRKRKGSRRRPEWEEFSDDDF
jgi:transcription termination/antitermination protein NusA